MEKYEPFLLSNSFITFRFRTSGVYIYFNHETCEVITDVWVITDLWVNTHFQEIFNGVTPKFSTEGQQIILFLNFDEIKNVIKWSSYAKLMPYSKVINNQDDY